MARARAWASMSALLGAAARTGMQAAYAYAGGALGLLQGYVLVLAELAAAVHFTTLEEELRKLLPTKVRV